MYFFNLKQKGKGKSKTAQGKEGFFLAELIVSVFIFGIVMTVSVGSLILALDANRKTQSLKSVLNNLNVVLDTMTRTIATGSHYLCGSGTSFNPENPDVADCFMSATDPLNSGEEVVNLLFNEDLDGNDSADDFITYERRVDSGGKGYIARTIRGGAGSYSSAVRMTAPEVDITSLRFYVSGSEPAVNGTDFEQPRVLIVVKGTAPAGPRNETDFTVQTLVTQRIPDFR
jgi:type II secretory pathway pseudopilin PulG